MIAEIFFLPIEDRPKKFPEFDNDTVKKLGRFWHTGIIVKSSGKVYECFNHKRFKISNLERVRDNEFKNAVLVKTNIDSDKLDSEIESGTDCAEYVARVASLSEGKGEDKGDLWPEDVYKLLLKRLN